MYNSEHSMECYRSPPYTYTIVHPFHSHLTSFLKVIETPFLHSSILCVRLYSVHIQMENVVFYYTIPFPLVLRIKRVCRNFHLSRSCSLLLPFLFSVHAFSLSTSLTHSLTRSPKHKHINCLAGLCFSFTLHDVHFCMYSKCVSIL